MRVFNFFRRLFTPLPIFFQRLFCIYKYFSSDFSAGRTYFSNDFLLLRRIFPGTSGDGCRFLPGRLRGRRGKAAPSPALPAGAALLWGDIILSLFFLLFFPVLWSPLTLLFLSSPLLFSPSLCAPEASLCAEEAEEAGKLSMSDNLRGMKRPWRMG